MVYSKAAPIIHSGLFEKVIVFSETKPEYINGVQFITLPKFIVNLKPKILQKILRLVYEPLQLICNALKHRPLIINGYYVIPKGLNSLIASRFSGSYCVMSIIGGKEEVETSLPFKFLSKHIIISLLKFADYITTKGDKDNTYLINNGLDQRKISIYNGTINIRKFCYNNEIKNIDILFSGYFDLNKGPQRALQIIKNISKSIHNLKAVFIGTGPLYNDMLKLCKQLELENIVTFKGFVHNAEYYFKRSKILVFPSANEGLSTAMLEAMACRCVPVTSNVGNQTEAAKHLNNSIVISSCNDFDSFSKASIQLLQDNDLLKSLAINAELIIINNYTVEKQADLFKNVYNRLFKNS